MRSSSVHRHTFVLAALLCAFVGLAQANSASGAAVPAGVAAAPASRDAVATFPPGDEGKLIAQGHDLVTETPKLMATYVRAGMSCEACHNDAGRKPHAGSFLGIYAKFPQWNKRAHRFITLQDRLAECFLYSMNGRPPAYDSREMIALTAYIAFLSRGAPVGEGFSGQRLIAVTAPHPPDKTNGAALYATRCAACHGADGAGQNGAFPPLWGGKSFNDGAGMHRLATMAAFVRYNMPYGAQPNSLSAQQAYDVSAYVLSHPRPHFDGARLVSFPAEPASHF
jgi:thiosulfate dehydrogenase